MVMPTERPTALAKIGREILRLRLFYGWSQAGLGRRARLSQGTISRLERGVQRGLCIRRLAAVMEALHVQEVTFQRPPTVPQTPLEIMLFGDRWQRALDAADRRLGWPAPTAHETADQDVDADGDVEANQDGHAGRTTADEVVVSGVPEAWFGGGG